MTSIKQIMEIPRLPQVSMEIINQAFSDEPDLQKVASLIEKDPVLTGKLFQTVNSASFGLRVKITSISQAVSIIGLDALRSSVVSIALGEYFLNSSLGHSLDSRNFCIHSLATAVIMKKSAEILGIGNADQFYLLGLLHNLGKIALDTASADDYGKVLDLVQDGLHFEEAEKRIFKVENRQIWMLLSRNWGFPDEIINLFKGTIKGETEIRTQKLIKDSSILAEKMGYRLIPDCEFDSPNEVSIFACMDESSIIEIGEAVREQVEILSQVMDLPKMDSKQKQKMLLHVIHELSKINSRYIKTHHELEYRVEELEELTAVFTKIIRSMDGDSLAFSVLEAAMEGFSADGAFLFMRKKNDGLTGYAAKTDENGIPDIDHMEIPSSEYSRSIEKCIDVKSPIKVRHPMEEEILKDSLGKVNTVWLAPIYLRGSFVAIIGVGIKDPGNLKCKKDDFGKILNIIAGEVALSIDNSQLFSRIQNEARIDALTGIFNRRTIMKILSSEFARFQRKPFPLSLAIFDMDYFKSINDTLGHLAGDDFLVKTANIFKASIRESDYIGRYGGDEFIAVFPETSLDDAHMVVERIRLKLLEFCKSFGTPEIAKMLSVSIGIAEADMDIQHADELINQADDALYNAKEAGRNCSFKYQKAECEPVV